MKGLKGAVNNLNGVHLRAFAREMLKDESIKKEFIKRPLAGTRNRMGYILSDDRYKEKEMARTILERVYEEYKSMGLKDEEIAERMRSDLGLGDEKLNIEYIRKDIGVTRKVWRWLGILGLVYLAWSPIKEYAYQNNQPKIQEIVKESKECKTELEAAKETIAKTDKELKECNDQLKLVKETNSNLIDALNSSARICELEGECKKPTN